MPSAEYRVTTHAEVPNLPAQLARLSNIAFAEYEGAMPVDEAFIQWYLQRPGCRPEYCTAALWEDELVSNVLVCIQDVRLGGTVMPCGIIDTVATLPEHRKKGLAHRLMEDAHRIMREAGAEAAVLYTNPDGHPYTFYQRLGYDTRAIGAALEGNRPDPSADLQAEPATLADHAIIRALTDREYSGFDGYAPLTDELWAWHRLDRPASLPDQLMVIRDASGAPIASCAFATVDVLVAGETARATVVSDIACPEPPEPYLQALLTSAPTERILTIVDSQAPIYQRLSALGFQQAVREAALAMPFSDHAREAMKSEPAPWYVMIESVVGV